MTDKKNNKPKDVPVSGHIQKTDKGIQFISPYNRRKPC